MTQDQPNRLDDIETALGRFAQLTMQNVVRHDEAVARHDEILSRLEENAVRHNESLNRLEANAARHDEALSRLEENVARHDEALSRLEANVARHDENFLQIESMLNELVRTMAEMAVQSDRDRLRNEALQAQHRAEIEEIWRYLRYEPRNGNGRGEG